MPFGGGAELHSKAFGKFVIWEKPNLKLSKKTGHNSAHVSGGTAENPQNLVPFDSVCDYKVTYFLSTVASQCHHCTKVPETTLLPTVLT